MAGPRRSPVRIETYLLNTIGICWPKITNKKIRFQMNILGEMLQEELNKKDGKLPKRVIKEGDEIEYSEGEEIRYFIAYFRDRYVQETDIEYKTKIPPDEIGVIKASIKKLKDKNISIKEYLSWVFDVFFDDDNIRRKFSPVVKVVCGTWVMSRFFMTNRDKIRKRTNEEDRISKRESIRKSGEMLFEKTGNEEIQRMLIREDNGSMTTSDLENYLSEYESGLEEESKDE